MGRLGEVVGSDPAISTFRRVWPYVHPHRRTIYTGVACMFVVAAAGLCGPWVVGEVIDTLNDQGRYPVAHLIAVFGGAVGVEILAGAIRNRLMHVAGQRFVLQIRKDAYAALQRLSFSFFDKGSTGDAMSRLSSDVDAIENMLVHGTDNIIVNVLRVIGIIAMLVYLDWRIALAVAVPAPFIALAVVVFGSRVRKRSREVRDQLGRLNAKLQENIAGIRVIKSFAAEEREYEVVCAKSDDYAERSIRLIRMWTAFYPTMEVVAAGGFVMTILVGAWLVEQGAFTTGGMVKAFGLLMMFYGPIHTLSHINETIQRALAAGDRVFELMNSEPDVTDAEDAIELEAVRGKVELRHVSLQYSEGVEVLRDVSIVAEPGECVALVGRSGAGKTSIINLIPRFYDPVEGAVLVDDIDVRRLRVASLRRNVALVLQDTFLFDTTIRENITYARPDATDEEVVAAARAAHAAEFIESFEEGYDTVVGERGVRLSGGQKQRIAIARAVLADPRILILDEATSSVDTESEVLIHQALDSLIAGRTTIIIAHRLSTVRNADKIVVLDDGRVAEQGKHDELMAKGGLYSRMCDLQFVLADTHPGSFADAS